MNCIGVIGQGFVGGNLAQVFAERGCNVLVYDKTGKKAPGVNDFNLQSIGDLVFHCRQRNFPNQQDAIFFVCLPTPMLANGECDLSIVEGALTELASHRAGIAVIKSTVPPGSSERWNEMFAGSGLQICHSPEFLREATALEDMRNQDRIVIGGSPYATSKVKQVFQQVFHSVPVIETTSTESEMIKYVANCFLATKVSFANEVYQICSKLGVSYDKVIEVSTLDKRLGNSHWQVPGPMPCDLTGKSSMGFSGSCFPKDLNALITLATKLGVKATMLKAAWNKNLEVRPQRDWEKLAGRAVSVPKYRLIKTGPLPIPNIRVPVHPAVERMGGPLMDLFSEKK